MQRSSGEHKKRQAGLAALCNDVPRVLAVVRLRRENGLVHTLTFASAHSPCTCPSLQSPWHPKDVRRLRLLRLMILSTAMSPFVMLSLKLQAARGDDVLHAINHAADHEERDHRRNRRQENADKNQDRAEDRYAERHQNILAAGLFFTMYSTNTSVIIL